VREWTTDRPGCTRKNRLAAARLGEVKDTMGEAIDFKEQKDGQLRALMGYAFDPAGSTEDTLLFTRPQPAKKT
jgi:hypothetical protein